MLKDVEILKIELFAKGMKITPLAEKVLSENKKRPITLAEYATTSGIPLQLEGDVWVNAPFMESFCQKSKIVFDYDGSNFFIAWQGKKYPVHPMPVPDYFDKKNKNGEPYVNFGITHTDRIRVSPIQGCFYSCKFCDLNQKLYKKNKISDLIEVIKVATNDKILPAKHGIISGGTPGPEDRDYFLKVLEEVPKAVSIPMDAFIAPWMELSDIEKIYNYGINELSINVEVWNKKIAKAIMPQKSAIGREYYLEFIKRAVEVFGNNRIRAIIIVGLEPLKDLFSAVESLAKIGCSPVLSPFRPSPKTALAGWPPPTVKQMIKAYEGSREIVKKYGVKLGPKCTSCQHNTLTFPDGSDYYN